MVQWQGVMPALMTEMDQAGGLDLDATARHLDQCMAAGCSGMIMLGTLGENTSLAPDEKVAVLSSAVEAMDKRGPVIAGIAEYTTDLSIDYAKAARAAGVDGLMALPCMVYQQDEREALSHFRSLAKATDLPIMIYNNPVGYKVDLKPSAFATLADCETIVAVKESSHDSRRMTDMVNALGDRFTLFCGVDDLALENILFGAEGWVSGMVNTFPREAVAMFNAAKSGDLDKALAIYRWLMPSLHLDTEVKLVQYIKLANQMTGMGSEWVRAPRLTIEGDERARVEAIIQTAIDTRPAV